MTTSSSPADRTTAPNNINLDSTCGNGERTCLWATRRKRWTLSRSGSWNIGRAARLRPLALEFGQCNKLVSPCPGAHCRVVVSPGETGKSHNSLTRLGSSKDPLGKDADAADANAVVLPKHQSSRDEVIDLTKVSNTEPLPPCERNQNQALTTSKVRVSPMSGPMCKPHMDDAKAPFKPAREYCFEGPHGRGRECMTCFRIYHLYGFMEVLLG